VAEMLVLLTFLYGWRCVTKSGDKSSFPTVRIARSLVLC
jgi:hypothetical protein